MTIRLNGRYIAGNAQKTNSDWNATSGYAQILNKPTNLAHTTGNETISGIKTFATIPLIPTASTSSSNTETANTLLVDNKISLHNSSNLAHNDIRESLSTISTSISTLDNSVVHKSNTEIITGTKVLNNSGIPLKLKSSVIDNTITPNSHQYCYTDYLDKNDVRLGVIGSIKHPTTGLYGVYLQAGNEGSLSILSDGINVKTEAPNPPSNSNDASIATTYWVKNNTKQLDNYITNTLLKIPQDINLELNNGTLTLKAGSKVYVPNGFKQDGVTPKFNEVIISNDIVTSFSQLADRTGLLIVRTTKNELGLTSKNNQGSGTSTPSVGWYYNINDNIIYRDTLDENNSFPIALCTLSSGLITSIDQVFNGFGYIGSTIFTLPGIKGLIPNGRNSDGSLINIEFETDSVFTTEVTQQALSTEYNLLEIGSDGISLSRYYDEVYNLPENPAIYTHVYSIPENRQYFYDGTSWQLNNGRINCARIYGETTIESLTPKTVFRIPDYNDVTTLLAPNYEHGISITESGFIAPSNGWIYCSLYVGDQGRCISYINGIKVGVSFCRYQQNETQNYFVKKGDVFTFSGGSIRANSEDFATFFPCIGY